MSRPRTVYTYNGDGFDRNDILVELYGDKAWRTILIGHQDLEDIRPWQIASHLNQAYDRGRKEAMEDLRRVLGIKD